MKALSFYKVEKDSVKEILEGLTFETLYENCFKPLGESDSRRIGFVPNLDGTFLSPQKEGFVLRIKEQIKKPEGYLVLEKLEASIKEYQDTTGLSATKKQKTSWKIEATEMLLPLAIPKEPKIYSMFIRNDGVIFCESNHAKADDLISLVRKTLGSFPAVPLSTENPVGDLLDDLVKNACTEGKSDDYLEVLSKATLVTDEERTVSLAKASLYNSEAQTLVADGAYVTSLELAYDGMVAFTLKEDLTLTGIKYASALSGDKEDENQAVTSEFLRLVELSKVINYIVASLDNED